LSCYVSKSLVADKGKDAQHLSEI